MSMAQIEAELQRLTADELRQLALQSWAAFVEREKRGLPANACEENDPRLLASLDDAIRRADQAQGRALTGSEARSSLVRWTTK